MTGNRLRRATAAALAATSGACALGVLGVLAAGPAAAATTGRIVESTTIGTVVEVVFAARDLPAGAAIDPASVRLSVGDKQLPTVVQSSAASATAGRRTVLVIDTSGSMYGAGLAGAKSAANAFLAAVPADVTVGLVTFDDEARTLVEPTTDRAKVRTAVAGLKASGDTALYDATLRAVRTAGTEGSRTILLLSDGQDDGSKASRTEAVNAVKSSGASLNAVSLGTASGQVESLQALAGAGRGFVATTGEADDLAAKFSNEARSISSQVLARGDLSEDLLDTSANLTVTAVAGGTSISDTVYTSFAPDAAPAATAEAYGPQPVASSPTIGSSAVLVFALLAVFVGLAILLGIALVGASDRDPTQSRMRRRMSIYTLTGRQVVKESETTTVLGTSGVARSAVDLAGRVTRRTDLDTMLTGKLEAAGLPLKPPEWTIIHLAITLGAALLLLLISGGNIVVSLIGLALGAAMPWSYLSYKERKRRNAFLDGLPDTLQLLAGSLSTGYSLPQAVDTVVREAADPIGTEFNRALVEARLGIPLEDALEGIGVRMRSVDFAWVVMAIRIQREVGGNLAEVLTTVAGTLRERERLRRQVDVLSAEGRLSAWILGALPVVFVMYLAIARPDYLRVLYTEPLGWAMIIVALTLFTVGIFWLRRAVAVEV